MVAAADPASYEEITKRKISRFKPRFEKASPPVVATPGLWKLFLNVVHIRRIAYESHISKHSVLVSIVRL